MGSGEGKERSRRRSRSPSSDSDSSPERKHKKSKKEHKHKHKSKHKKHKKHSSEVDDQQLAAAKAFLEQHLKQTAGGDAGGSGAAAAALAAAAAAGGGGGGKSSKSSSKGREKPAGELPADVDPLTADDYFERSAEFTLWLQETRNQYFNELTSDQTHTAFRDFVLAWNSGRLPLRYYTGLTAAPLKRTSHNWGFKGKQQGSGAAAAAGKTGMAAYLSDQQEQRAGERVAAAGERRVQRKEQKELLDELLPRATAGTREARVEARLARREEAKAREDSPDLMVAGGANIMGGDDSFAAAKAREAKRQDWRNKQQAAKKEELAHKLSAAAQAEADKMAQFKALVAAQGGKISIAKRQ